MSGVDAHQRTATPIDGATEFADQFACSFGKDAALGCFEADGLVHFARRERVLLQSPRGLEVGEVLGVATLRQARLLGAHVRGQVIRALRDDDRSTIAEMHALAGRVLGVGEEVLRERDFALPLLDAEAFFDLRHVLVHILHPDPDILGPLADAMSERAGVAVRFANLALPAEKSGCGEPDCGGGECDSCATGGCATGCGTHAPPDLRPYFAHLRDDMERKQRIRLV